MKNIKLKLLGLIIVMTIMSSCKKFLTTDPESSYSVNTSYQSQSDFNFAITGVYAKQQELYGGTDNIMIYAFTQRSDDTRNGANSSDGIDRFTDNDATTKLPDYYKRFWEIIYRSNLILDKIDGVTFTDENLKKSIKGEAYALRAWSYFNLAELFGGMPLIKTVKTVEETKTIVRSTQMETFAASEDDYKKAITLLPLTWTGTNLGRITKYAAEGGLARQYMFQSNFAAAKPLLADIINSGLYAMEAKYIDCFDDSHDNGKERVWEIQFHGAASSEACWGGSLFLPEVNNYLPSAVKGTANGNGFYASLSMENAYESGDLRKDISIKSGIKIGNIADPRSYIIKFCSFDKYVPTSRSDWATNFPILRYTDVKMMYAECLNEEGYVANGEAFNIINAVRARAGLAPLTTTDAPDKAAFRNTLIKERRIEFAFEGLRWPDLIRWGIAESVINANFQTPDEGNGLYSMKSYQKIYAIPSDELNRYNDKTVMFQNPGY